MFTLFSTVADCGTLSVANGEVTFEAAAGRGETEFESVATYTCNTGYNLVGNAMRTCQADGTWSGSDPLCQSKYVPSDTYFVPLPYSLPHLSPSSLLPSLPP